MKDNSNKVANFTGKLKGYLKRFFKRGYIYWTILSFILFGFLCAISPAVNKDKTAVYYLLSSISQALAALFALVFTIMLIMIQAFQRYNVWQFIKDKRTKFFIFTFSMAVMLPILFLRLEYFPALILNGLVAYAFFCVFNLIPFFYSIHIFLAGPFILGEFEADIFHACEISAWKQAISYLDNFKENWLEKIKKNDSSSWDEFLSTWHNIIIKERRSSRLFSSFFNISISLCYAYTKKKREDYAIKVYDSFKLDSNDLLSNYRSRAIDDDNVYRHYVRGTLDILITAFKKKFNELPEDIIKTLGKLALRKNDKQTINELYKIDNTFVIKVLMDNSMVAYLDGSQDSFIILTKWLEEIDVKKVDQTIDKKNI